MAERMMLSAAVCVVLAVLARGRVSRAQAAADLGLIAAAAAVLRLFDGVGAASSVVFCAAAALGTASGSVWGVGPAVLASVSGAAMPAATFLGGLTGLMLAVGLLYFVHIPGEYAQKIVRWIAASAFAAMAVCTIGV